MRAESKGGWRASTHGQEERRALDRPLPRAELSVAFEVVFVCEVDGLGLAGGHKAADDAAGSREEAERPVRLRGRGRSPLALQE